MRKPRSAPCHGAHENADRAGVRLRILLHPQMAPKTCFLLALGLLVLALARGNPFLRAPAAALTPAPAAASPGPGPVAVPSVTAVPLRARAAAVPAESSEGGVVLASVRGGLPSPGKDTGLGSALEPCPDPALQALVVAVRRAADGHTVWVLADGRAVRRNPAHDPRHPTAAPVLVVAEDGSASGAAASR